MDINKEPHINNMIKKKVFLTTVVFIMAFFILLKTAAATNIGTNISTAGSLTVDGALKFTSGAGNSFILTTDASGNTTWIAVSGALRNIRSRY